MSKCACGEYGSWDHSISGTSGLDRVVWRGCQYHPGTAIGRPVPAKVLARGLAAVRRYETDRADAEMGLSSDRALARRLGIAEGHDQLGELRSRLADMAADRRRRHQLRATVDDVRADLIAGRA